MSSHESIRVLKPIFGFASFCIRHLFAFFVTVAAACVVWTIVYFALLLWAIFTDGGIGGPLAYPAGLLFVLVSSTLAVFLLFLPSTALAELVARRCGFPILSQIPISIALLALLCLLVVGIVRAYGHGTLMFEELFAALGVFFGINLLPMGLYWWVAQSGPLVLSIYRRFRPNKRP